MSVWARALRDPQRLWIRRAMFQVHLWTGLSIGLYVVVVFTSGSALVFRNQLHEYFSRPIPTVPVTSTRLSDDDLRARARTAYPSAEHLQLWPAKRPDQAVEMWLERGNTRMEELFDPYTGQDLGAAEPVMVRLIVWLAALHDELLEGETGRTVNGVGGLLLTMTSLTGAVIWWPGIASWRRSLTVDWRANWKRVNWSLHSAVGFWAFIAVFLFAFTGFYLVFQDPFMAVVNYFEPAVRVVGRRRPRRTGDIILRWLALLHFGRFSWPVSVLWVVAGLVPPVLFVTGALMWWNRFAAPKLRGTDSPSG